MIGSINNTPPRIISWLLLFVLTAIWGSSFILIKKGLAVYSASEVAAIRILTAGIFLLPFALSSARQVPRLRYGYIFLSGLIGSLIPALLFAIAQTKLQSAVTGMINSLTPVFVIIVGALFFDQRITTKMIVGLLIAFGGTAILMVAGSGSILAINFFAAFVVLATVLYGFNVNILKFHLAELNPVAVSSISIVLCSPFAMAQLFLFTDFTDQLVHEEGAISALGFLVLLGVFGTGLALILFNYLIRISTPLFASSVTYLIPIVAVFWGIIDGESLSLLHYGSMAIIIAGVYLANKK